MLPKFRNPTRFFNAPPELFRLFGEFLATPKGGALFLDFLLAGRFSTPPFTLSIDWDLRRSCRLGLKDRLLLALLLLLVALFRSLTKLDLKRSNFPSGVSLIIKSSQA